jgi:hypothetical protein
VSTESINPDNSAGQPYLLIDNTTDGEIFWGPDHPQWHHYYQRGVPAGGHHTSRDDHSQRSSLPSTAGSDYEDSDSRRARNQQEKRERQEMNMNRPDNTMYRAIKGDQKKKKTEKRKNRQENRHLNLNSKKGREEEQGDRGRG